MQKNKFCQIDLRIVKLPNLTENVIIISFDLRGQASMSDIFSVTAVANSRICTDSLIFNMDEKF